jgi:chaperonin cofactor prefoldin
MQLNPLKTVLKKRPPTHDAKVKLPNITHEELIPALQQSKNQLKAMYSDEAVNSCDSLHTQVTYTKIQLDKVEKIIKDLNSELTDLINDKDNLRRFLKRAQIYLNPLPQISKWIQLLFILLLLLPFILSGYFTITDLLQQLGVIAASFSLVTIFQYTTGKFSKNVHCAPYMTTGNLQQSQAKRQLFLASAISVLLGVALLVYLEVQNQKTASEVQIFNWNALVIALFASGLFILWLLFITTAAKKEILMIADFLIEIQDNTSDIVADYQNKQERFKEICKRLEDLQQEIFSYERNLLTLSEQLNQLTQRLYQKLQERNND